jgi:glutamate dehydrogenase
MRATATLDKQIRRIKSKNRQNGSSGKDASAFMDVLFAQASPDDIARIKTEHLAARARKLWDFVGQRKPGRHNIRIYNLEDGAGADGTNSTVIEMINDDMPFLFDSVLGALNEHGLAIQFVLHPVLSLARDRQGRLEQLKPASAKGDRVFRESLIHIELERIDDPARCDALADEISGILEDVRIVVLDWPLMRDRVAEAIETYQKTPPPVPVDQLAEAIQLLDWLSDDNFTFLGLREYDFVGGPKSGRLKIAKGSSLGLLRDQGVKVLRRGSELISFTPEVREFLFQPVPLIITKANIKATVHRRVHMDYIGIKRFDDAGRLAGELRVIGLFTSAAYNRNPRFIPYLRRKVADVMERSELPPDSHSGKALLNVLENYPRDELFQIDVDTLARFALDIFRLMERPRTKLYVRKDKFDRFVAVLTFIPRDRYDTDVRRKLGELLADEFDGRVSAFYPSFPEGALVRIHYVIGRYSGETPSPDLHDLEAKADKLVRTWQDGLAAALDDIADKSRAQAVKKSYLEAFGVAYQTDFSVEEALADIDYLDKLTPERGIGINFYRSVKEAPDVLKLKLYSRLASIALSDCLPILENMGLKAINELTYQVTRREGDVMVELWVQDIVLQTFDRTAVRLSRVESLLEDCFSAVWHGDAENDAYNSLVLKQAIAWRDVSVLRAVSKYLRQAQIPFSQDYMAATLSRHGDIAARLVALFHARFNLDDVSNTARAQAEQRIETKIERALGKVASLDEDRILRRFANLIKAMLRTNFFARTQQDDIKPPKPFAEIFVYAPDVEGVHLRAGRIARGGLRWSDRPEDFRTEVLGLAKAQQVKNGVIVPVGAKGGFVPKKLPLDGGREAVLAEGVRCYRIFISSLLDLTDNLKGRRLEAPRGVIRHDPDDPYLVVAADKGTATFSDIANSISQAHGFWLDDAFASGGSAGYDHKKMGITARGAWEAVKRHFREMDVDIQTHPFTAIGVGDMSGDVFGNGMLLSKQTRVLAAFDHRDIFVDPDPDPAKSYKERKRMFSLTRSSWRDYDTALISKGGGIFSRAEKSLALSPEIKRLTGLTAGKVTPDELIHALLKSKADLLWFGGIGTYVRASGETDTVVGDRANDAIRVTARELNVKVIGEGANLGITQLGRIEFAAGGGRINTDAVDNSAGVNSSDLEVNIKIALGSAETQGDLTRKRRNVLLKDMTREVADLVLRNNYQQTLSLSLSERRGVLDLEDHGRFMRALEAQGVLDREIEFLPDDMALTERIEGGQPLTRPELAVLLAYAKITLFDQLLASPVPDDPYLSRELIRYFPAGMHKAYAKPITKHRLRREIISTMLANSMVNRGGPGFVSRLVMETGASIADVAASFALARDAFSLIDLNSEIDGLDNRLSGDVQLSLYMILQNLLHRQTIWFLRNVPIPKGIEHEVMRFRSGIARVEKALGKVMSAGFRQIVDTRIQALRSQGVPNVLAARFALLRFLSRAPEIVLVADQTGRPVEEATRILFTLSERLNIAALISRAEDIGVTDFFDRLALRRQVENLFEAQRALTADILQIGSDDSFAIWQERHHVALKRTETALADMLSSGDFSLSKLTVASGYVRDLLPS